MTGLEVDVAMTTEAWSAKVPGVDARIHDAIAGTLAHYAPTMSTRPRAVCVLLADDATLHRLNRRFRNQDKPTNVLSFPAAKSPDGFGPESFGPEVFGGEPFEAAPLGDIALAFETVTREAAAEGKPVADHLTHLIVHGTLHLLGFTHDEDGPAQAMMEAETEVLRGLGVPDPYAPRAPDTDMGAA